MSENMHSGVADAAPGDGTSGVRLGAHALSRPSVRRSRIPFLLALVLVAFVLRAGAAVVVDQVSHATGRDGYVERDDQSYDGTAWLQAQAWRGVGPEVPPDSRYLLNVYTYTQAGLYFLIGHQLLAMKLLNCLFGALTAGFVYLIARQLFGPAAAAFSGIVAAFFPSTFFYSLVNFKDAMFILLVALLLWLVTRLLATARWPLILPLLVVLALIGSLRPFIQAQLGLIVPLAVMLQRRAHFPRKWGTAGLLLVGCASVLWVTGGASWFGITPVELNDRRFMMAAGGRSSYIPTPVPPTPVPPTPRPTTVPTTAPPTAIPAAPKVTTPSAAAAPTTTAPPAVPSNLRAGRVTDSSIEMLWDDNADNETGFVVVAFREDLGDTIGTRAAVAADTTAYALNGVPTSAMITVYVTACSEAGCSDWSNYLTVGVAAPTPVPVVPAAPIIPPPSTTEDGPRRSVDSLGSLLRWLPTGLTYVLAAPFPWAARRAVELAMIPEMLLWYAALVCATIGLIVHRRRWRHYAPILGYLAATLLTLGVAQGNLGTLVRQRGMLIPFTLIFSGAGAAWLWSRWRSRLVPRARVGGE